MKIKLAIASLLFAPMLFAQSPNVSSAIGILRVQNGGTGGTTSTGAGPVVLQSGGRLIGPDLGNATCITINGIPIEKTSGGYLSKTANLSDLLSASAARSNLGLGTAATSASSAFAPAAGPFPWAGVTGAPSFLTSSGPFAWANVTGTPTTLAGYGITNGVANTVTVNGHALSSNVTVTPTDLSLVIGTNVQAYAANLTSWAAVAPSSYLTTASAASTYAPISGAALTSATVNGVTITGSGTLATGSGGTLGTAAYTAASTYAPVAGDSSIVTVGTLSAGAVPWSLVTSAPAFITGNQTITLSGNVTGSGTTAITTTIGAGVVTNAMLAGSIDLTSKVTGALPVTNGGTGQTTASAALTALGGQTANANLVTNKALCQGRIYTVTGTPIQASSTAGASNIYYGPTPWGDHITLYSGSVYVTDTIAESSVAGSTLSASTLYDMGIYDVSGTPTIHMVAWTNTTTRATALTYVAGIPYVVVSGVYYRYVGSVYCNASKQFDFILGTFATSGQGAVIGFWNLYNQIPLSISTGDTTASWAYSTATWRPENNNTANSVQLVTGLSTGSISAVYFGISNTTSTASLAYCGVGINSTSSPTGGFNGNSLSSFSASTPGQATIFLAPGLNTVTALEKGTAATQDFYGSGRGQSALVVSGAHF